MTSDQESDAILPRSLRGRYQLGAPIGAGGMGAVHEVHDLELGRTVALKRIRGGHAPELQARFEAEARALARLEHPNIVRIHAFGWEEDGPWMLMERLEGLPLDQLPRMPDAQERMLEAAAGLQAMHAEGLVHRDVKPSNLLLLADRSRVVLLDFGIVRDLSRVTRTRTGLVMGTLGYIAPEVLEGLPATPAADWYSWGVTLFELLEGRLPHSPAEALDRARGREPPGIEFRVIDPDGAAARALGACLERDPLRRPRGLGDLRRLLCAEGTGEGAPAEVGEPAPARVAGTTRIARPRAPRRRILWVLPPVAAALLLASRPARPPAGIPEVEVVEDRPLPEILRRVWRGPEPLPRRADPLAARSLRALQEARDLRDALLPDVAALATGAGGDLLEKVRALAESPHTRRDLDAILAPGGRRLGVAWDLAIRSAEAREDSSEWLAVVFARLGAEVSPFLYSREFRVGEPPGSGGAAETTPPAAFLRALRSSLNRGVGARLGIEVARGARAAEYRLWDRATEPGSAGGAFARERRNVALYEWVRAASLPVDPGELGRIWATRRDMVLAAPGEFRPWLVLGFARGLARVGDVPGVTEEDRSWVLETLRRARPRLPDPARGEAARLLRTSEVRGGGAGTAGARPPR